VLADQLYASHEGLLITFVPVKGLQITYVLA
jgi:hypothetical protein